MRSPGVSKLKPRAKRGSKLDAYKEYIDVRLSEGLENCVVQWDGLVNSETKPKREALAVQVSAQQMERRSLDIYELMAGGGVR